MNWSFKFFTIPFCLFCIHPAAPVPKPPDPGLQRIQLLQQRAAVLIQINAAVRGLSGGLSREALQIYQLNVLLDELKTSDVKYMAIEEAGRSQILCVHSPHTYFTCFIS